MATRAGRTQHTQRRVNKDRCIGAVYKGNCKSWFIVYNGHSGVLCGGKVVPDTADGAWWSMIRSCYICANTSWRQCAYRQPGGRACVAGLPMYLYLESQHLLMADWKAIAGRKLSEIQTKHRITASTGYRCILGVQMSIILSSLPQAPPEPAHATKYG